MPFPEERELDYVEAPVVGFLLRAFTERAFGVWQDGRVVAVDRRRRVVKLQYAGYAERRPFDFGFFYPRGHERSGQAFNFD